MNTTNKSLGAEAQAIGSIGEEAHSREDGRGPRYFHLLWDEELERLRPVLHAVHARREQVLASWYQLYELHFADQRTLSRTEFDSIYGQDLDSSIGALKVGDVERFVIGVRRVGNILAARQVPFAEVVASMHLFEESACSVFPPQPEPTTALYQSFDKLSHCRMIVLADAYFRSTSAAASARIYDLEQEAARLPMGSRWRFRGLIGVSHPMQQLFERIEAAAAVRGTILIVGESGTGKELVARAIHEASAESHAPFTALNCAAIPRDLIESELFGHKKGAFSGAATDHLGLFRAADKGTLFLDEITEMHAETQSKLLRAIQERRVRPVGSSVEIPVDIRLVASTNRDPEQAIREGLLRHDLYYRLQANTLRVPPLREHPEDLPLLVDHFIAMFNEKLHRHPVVRQIEPEALAALERYGWPGNVRELSNVIESAFTFGRTPTIGLSDLPEALTGFVAHAQRPTADPRIEAGGVDPMMPRFADVERDLIRRALATTRGNKLRAAAMLQISRKKLYAKIKKYGLA